MKFLVHLATLFVVGVAVCAGQVQQGDGWPTTGGGAGGERYSAATQIDPSNVSKLHPVWTYHTGAIHWIKHFDGSRTVPENERISAFEVTPVLFNGMLYLSTPADVVIALDPASGKLRWRFDPKNKTQSVTSRGVAVWEGPAGSSGPCANRILLGTLDAKLIALDAATGAPCQDFGAHGQVDLTKNVNFHPGEFYAVTSPPTVVGNVVIVGSSIQDNWEVDTALGVVRAYDCRSGRLLWTWDPIPWSKSQKLRTGAANAWSIISADPEHGLIYVPTGSASPDFYGGMRLGDNRDSDSVVALEAATGKKVWAFQTTHHDVWDYDVASEPVLFTFRGKIPAVAVTTKMGLVFVLNRLTGEPLYPVTERKVPQTDVPGEVTSPTQPFADIASFSPVTWPKDAKLGLDENDDRACRAILGKLRYDGIYTPPSLQGTLLFPANLGGVNWGSPAFDPQTGILYANTNRYAFSVVLIPRKSVADYRIQFVSGILMVAILLVLVAGCVFRRSIFPGWPAIVVVVLLAGIGVVHHLVVRPDRTPSARIESERAEKALATAHFGAETGEQAGTPYRMFRKPLDAPSGAPCTPQPWGTVGAINLNTGKTVWQTPLGTMKAGEHTGTLNLGGPIVTAGGLVFTAASTEPYLRAFNAASGEEVWKARLPVPAQATPMTYSFNGKQYVVICAGGHGSFGTPLGDSVIAFALD
jgi:quinoprotein glucose dehydrogenase